MRSGPRELGQGPVLAAHQAGRLRRLQSCKMKSITWLDVMLLMSGFIKTVQVCVFGMGKMNEFCFGAGKEFSSSPVGMR